MNRRLLYILLAALGVSGAWLGTGVLEAPQRRTDLHVGDAVDVPSSFRGQCLRVVVFHGSCEGCEKLVPGRDRAWWVTLERHPRDVLFPRVVVSPDFYHALKIHGIPTEFVITRNGTVAYIGNPVTTEPDVTCEALGERRE